MNVEVNPLVARLEESATEIVDNEIKRMKRSGVKDIVSLGVGEPYFDTPGSRKHQIPADFWRSAPAQSHPGKAYQGKPSSLRP
jgi:aspartate/methionine/tyrosine aminotransferase